MIKPIVLCVLDGWGHGADGPGNAIMAADTPFMDGLFARYPHALLQASEGYVGLPEGQMGNSEVGHTNLGAGRVVLQDLPRIDLSVTQDSLRHHPEILQVIDHLKLNGGVCHLMGLLSPGGVHSHQMHFEYVAKLLASQGIPVRVHGFLDGRDTPPQSAYGYVGQMLANCSAYPSVQMATLSGRYYAMDRDNRWDRVQKAYEALVAGQGVRAFDPLEAIESSYANGITDEFMLPTVVGDYKGMCDGDVVFMINFRADRARELLTALLEASFDKFPRGMPIKFTQAIGMVSYGEKLDPLLTTLFMPELLTHTLGEVLAQNGLKQLRVAETEKYAHVTFFFNGGQETQFPGEDRILVPSPAVATYDLMPQMSAVEVTDKLVEAIHGGCYDVIIVNYANPDMVGHTGDRMAAIQSVQTIDACMERLTAAVLNAGGVLMITADHGNVEVMIDEISGQPHTAHTLNPVPFLVISDTYADASLKNGSLSDVAPTILKILGVPVPAEMTGQSLWEMVNG
ncbi:MAG: 2,3-bisphosphoglycerate-independent phosphoglycerate mutase [Alphaproteobacteria bacterium]|nr:2,3-bisphosphoglycerate-independent phosphoglycerate mutase [Alphaproteobacteria bacterium]